jgi:hypothetical protein
MNQDDKPAPARPAPTWTEPAPSARRGYDMVPPPPPAPETPPPPPPEDGE